MFKKILVATDGSDHASRAVNAAADLAAKYDAELIIGHVLLHGEPPSAFKRMAEVEHLVREPKTAKPDSKNIPGGLVAFAAKAEQARIDVQVMEILAERILAHAKEIAKKKGVKNVSTEIAEGDPANRVLKMAEKFKPDLVVVGTRGFGPLRSLLIGSVSQKIHQIADCACLTIK